MAPGCCQRHQHLPTSFVLTLASQEQTASQALGPVYGVAAAVTQSDKAMHAVPLQPVVKHRGA